MNILGVIPARLKSTRLPEKLIRKICDKYIIQYVWERVKSCKSITKVVIATDHKKIKEICEGFGATVMMTSDSHQSGTDRLVEVAKVEKAHIIVNIQGDEPLIKTQSIEKLIKPFLKDKNLQMATLACKSKDKKFYADSNVVKVVIDNNGYAMFFSRATIPYYRESKIADFYKHIGLYAYRRHFLLKIPHMKKSKLEVAEKLEQLRILENGYKIKVIEVNADSLGIDTLEDLHRFEKIVKRGGKF